ncbi:MAG: ATP-binding protein [Bacteroidota bacterium]
MLPFFKYNIPKSVLWLIGIICVLPVLLNIMGVDFGTVTNKLDPYQLTKISEYEHQSGLKDFLLGRNFHTIFVSFTIAIAFLTVILAFVDYRIKRDVSTPIVGIALFCAGLLDTFHILVSTQVINVPDQQIYLTAFTWFFCRLFHASILILGVGIFLVRIDLFREENRQNARRFVLYSGIVFVALTLLTIKILLSKSEIDILGYPNKNIARSYDLIPLVLYIISAFFLFPKFYELHPSVFSQTLLLSSIPSIATQLYMAFGSEELYDNNFNIAHFMTAFSYFIPFIGLSFNYLETHKNEQRVIKELNHEAARRRGTQEILSGVLNSSASSIMGLKAIRNSAGHIIDFEWMMVNKETENIFGVNPDKVINKKMSKEMPVAFAEGWLDLFISVIDGGRPLNREYFSGHFNKWLHMMGTKLNDGIAVTINDVSGRKNALKELMDAEKLAVTGRISRTIAHEVRNPLTNIDLSLEQVKDSFTGNNEEAKPYLDIIARNSHRINQLITELLDSSKPTQIEVKACNVNSLLDNTLQLAIDRIHLKKIKLVKEYGENIPVVMLDDEKVKTALINLIINAVEAMEEEKGILTIRTRQSSGRCIIEVEDNGSGISKENLENLFVPFFSKKSKGMGLGLTAAQNIIITHKGTIDVQSTVGKGTKFTVTF